MTMHEVLAAIESASPTAERGLMLQHRAFRKAQSPPTQVGIDRAYEVDWAGRRPPA